MILKKRLAKLEGTKQPVPLRIERIIYDSREQHKEYQQHPERFERVLINEKGTRKIFELQRV